MPEKSPQHENFSADIRFKNHNFTSGDVASNRLLEATDVSEQTARSIFGVEIIFH
jgi:hypothetical protein